MDRMPRGGESEQKKKTAPVWIGCRGLDRPALACRGVGQVVHLSAPGRDRALRRRREPGTADKELGAARAVASEMKKTLSSHSPHINLLASPAPYTAKWTPTATRPYFWNMALVRAA